MGNIEPELTSKGIEKAKEEFRNETVDQKKARKQRYGQAFERYQQAYEGYMATLNTQVVRYRRESFQRAEMGDRGREQGSLDSIQQQFLRFS